MAGSITDKLRKGAPAFSTTLAADKGVGASSATLSSTATIPTTTAVDFTVGRIDANGNKTPATKAVYTATISGSTISNLTLVEGTDQLHKAGTPVEITLTAASWNSMVDWGLTEHNQNGTHNSSLVAMLAGTQTLTGNKTFSGTTVFTGTTTLPSATVATSNIIDDAVNGAKMINGVVLSRVGGNSTNWSTNGTTSYDTSTTDVKTVMGSTATTGLTTTVSFGMTFTNIPLVIASPHGNGGVYSAFYITSESTTGFAFVAQTSANLPSFTWVAYGV